MQSNCKKFVDSEPRKMSDKVTWDPVRKEFYYPTARAVSLIKEGKTLFDRTVWALCEHIWKQKENNNDFCLLKHGKDWDKWFMPKKIKSVLAMVLWEHRYEKIQYNYIFQSADAMAGLNKYQKWYKYMFQKDNKIPFHKKNEETNKCEGMRIEREYDLDNPRSVMHLKIR